MIGIQDIAYYICETRENNLNKTFNGIVVDEEFVKNKIGIEQVSRKKDDEKASDLCVYAYKQLIEKNRNIDINNIDLISVCTQNGDYNIPHTSAIIHHKLGAKKECATFDISLGCSGYVYSLDIVISFMEKNNYKNALLFTADPYSNILDKEDKNTNLIFGDAASVTLMSCNPKFEVKNSIYHSFGDMYETLIKRDNQPLFMDGKMIFNFTLMNVPEVITKTFEANDIKQEEIDKFIFHQANKYMVSKLVKRLKVDSEKVPVKISDYGNTVSSSIPIILSDYLDDDSSSNILLCGFGVGLSIASTIIKRV